MSDYIVSHVASPEYRDHFDEMRCAEPGCKRWRVDDRSDKCPKHRTIKLSNMRDLAAECEARHAAEEALVRGCEMLARPRSRDVDVALAKRREHIDAMESKT